MKIKQKVHHLGVKINHSDSLQEYLDFHAVCKMGREPEFKTKNIILEYLPNHWEYDLKKDTYLELVIFEEENSLEKGLYHTCYEVENIEKVLPHYYGNGYKKISNIVDSVIWGGKIVYLYSKYLGFLELVER